MFNCPNECDHVKFYTLDGGAFLIDEVARYAIDGKRIAGETKGINIVKISDGSVKKLIIK